MKKILAIALAMVSFGAFANNSFMYFMLDEGAKIGDVLLDDTISYGVKVKAIQGSDPAWSATDGVYLDLYYGNWDSATDQKLTGVEVDEGNYIVELTNAMPTDSYTYFIELYNDSSVSPFAQGKLNYTAEMIGSMRGMSVPTAGVAMMTQFTPTPEPTSGLLLLIGTAALALRRRRMIQA